MRLLRERNEKLTEVEFTALLDMAERLALDPLRGQLYMIPRTWIDKNNKTHRSLSIQTGIDGLRAIASRTGQLAGISDAACVYNAEKALVSATVTVKRQLASGYIAEFVGTARWDEFCPKRAGDDRMWQAMEHVMLGKVAEAIALRKAFPSDLAGIFADVEMMQADAKEQLNGTRAVAEMTAGAEPVAIQEKVTLTQAIGQLAPDRLPTVPPVEQPKPTPAPAVEKPKRGTAPKPKAEELAPKPTPPAAPKPPAPQAAATGDPSRAPGGAKFELVKSITEWSGCHPSSQVEVVKQVKAILFPNINRPFTEDEMRKLTGEIRSWNGRKIEFADFLETNGKCVEAAADDDSLNPPAAQDDFPF
jgi:phage recombination protein Bet